MGCRGARQRLHHTSKRLRASGSVSGYLVRFKRRVAGWRLKGCLINRRGM